MNERSLNKKKLVLFCSPRTSERSSAGLKVLGAVSKQEEDFIVVLMQDSILLASNKLHNSSSEEEIDVLAKASETYVLNEHLVRRGFSPDSLRQPFKEADYDKIVELIMREDVQIMGSF